MGQNLTKALANHDALKCALFFALGALAYKFSVSPSDLSRIFLSNIKRLPGVAGVVAKQTNETVKQIKSLTQNEELDRVDPFGKATELPEKPLDPSTLIEGMKSMRGVEKLYREGKAFGGIYYDGKIVKEGINSAYCLYADSNGLYPNIFPALRKYELEVILMTANLLHGGEETCGALTTGGSESIIMAMKAYREWGLKKGIRNPEVIFSNSAHPAVAKACHLLGLKAVCLSACATTFQLSPSKVRDAVTSNTVCVFASAPDFAHGIIDPIAGLSEVLQPLGIGIHVDCCLGGFILPWMEKHNHLKPGKCFDFRVPGVQSISADLHKYGYGSKGCSVLLYRTHELRKCMFYAYTEWCGGMYCSPSMTGSRAGGIIASAWAGMMLLGKSGYEEAEEKVWHSFTLIKNAITDIAELELIGDPDACCISFTFSSSSPLPRADIYKVAAAIKEVGQWSLNYCQKPICCQLQIGCRTLFSPEQFVADLREAVVRVKANPSAYSGGLAQIYGMAANLGDREIVSDLLIEYLDQMYTM